MPLQTIVVQMNEHSTKRSHHDTLFSLDSWPYAGCYEESPKNCMLTYLFKKAGLPRYAISLAENIQSLACTLATSSR